MVKRVVVLAMLLGGCLPDYDNAYPYSAVVGTDLGSDMGRGCTGDSHTFISGPLFATDTLTDQAAGPYLRIEGCDAAPPSADDPAVVGVSRPAAYNVNLQGVVAEIPTSFIGDPVFNSRYLILEGAYTGSGGATGTVLKTYFAPPAQMNDTTGRWSGQTFHFMDARMGDIRDKLAAELAARTGDPATFASNYVFAYGVTKVFGQDTALNVTGATWMVDGETVSHGADCNLAQESNCCVFYANSFDVIDGGAHVIDDAGEAANQSLQSFFAVVCKDDGTNTADVTLTQTSSALSYIDSHTVVTLDATHHDAFNHLQFPRRHGAAVVVEFLTPL